MIKILDTTLREGEQSAGVFFTVEEKLAIAKMLDEFGVDIIEAGAPAVSVKIAQAVKTIAHAGLRAKILAHARPLISEIDQVIDCKVNQIGLFLASSNLHLKERLHMTKKEAIDLSVKGIKYAKRYKLEVRYTPEDATRTEIGYLLEICKKAKQAGADRIGIADTVGVEEPENYGSLIKTIVREIDIPVEVHCHNDLGLALANALSGIQNGASYASVTINGIGERTGITDLAELVMALKVIYKEEMKYNLKMLPKLSSCIEKLSSIYMADNKPIVGNNAFSHKAGLHTDAVLKNPKTFEVYDPQIINRSRSIIVDRYAGKRALANKLENFGLKVPDEELLKILKAVKEYGDKHRIVHDSDILDIVERTTGKKAQVIPREINALILITVESHIYTSSIVRKLKNFKGIENVFEITGESDIEALVKTKDITELNNVIEDIKSLPGIQKTNTKIILKQYNGTTKTAPLDF